MKSSILFPSLIPIYACLDWKCILKLDCERENVNNINKINSEVFFIYIFYY